MKCLTPTNIQNIWFFTRLKTSIPTSASPYNGMYNVYSQKWESFFLWKRQDEHHTPAPNANGIFVPFGNCVDRNEIPLSYFADVQAGSDWIFETIEGKKLLDPANVYPQWNSINPVDVLRN